MAAFQSLLGITANKAPLTLHDLVNRIRPDKHLILECFSFPRILLRGYFMRIGKYLIVFRADSQAGSRVSASWHLKKFSAWMRAFFFL